jgi:alcohol dehydrogenase class IV
MMIFFDNPGVGTVTTPRQVMMGDGASAKLADLLKGWQVQPARVLLVADHEVTKLGLIDAIKGPLVAGGFEAAVFDAIVGEPLLETALDLTDFARGQAFGAVVGVGGGSAMDMAKLAAALITNTGGVKDYLGAVTFPKAPLPLALVPTTAGTGAEATSVSMLSIEGRKSIVVSPQLIPQAAVLDPSLTLSLPPQVTAATGLDALSHACEAYMSIRANPFTDGHALTAAGIIARWLKTAYEDGANMEARRAMIFAAYLGGLCLNAGVVVGHSVAYTISNRTRTPHGISCTMALPYTILLNRQVKPERLKALAEVALKSPGATAEDLALWIDDLNACLGMPRSLKEIGIEAAGLDEMVEECLTRYPRPTNPVALSRERLKPLYEAMHAGDVRGFAQTVSKV